MLIDRSPQPHLREQTATFARTSDPHDALTPDEQRASATPTRQPRPVLSCSVDLQACGVRWIDEARARAQPPRRRRAVGPQGRSRSIDQTVMVPILNHASALSPYVAQVAAGRHGRTLLRAGIAIARDRVSRGSRASTRCRPPTACRTGRSPRCTRRDVLATTVLQTCIRYENRETACQFCAIGQSLAAKSTDRAKDARAAGRGGDAPRCGSTASSTWC